MNKPFYLMLAVIVLPAITGTTVLGQERRIPAIAGPLRARCLGPGLGSFP